MVYSLRIRGAPDDRSIRRRRGPMIGGCPACPPPDGPLAPPDTELAGPPPSGTTPGNTEPGEVLPAGPGPPAAGELISGTPGPGTTSAGEGGLNKTSA